MTLPAAPSQSLVLSTIKRRLGNFVVEGWQGRSGDEVYQAIARVFSHLSLRARFALLSAYLRRAEGASRHQTTLRLKWSDSADGFTLPAGSLVFSTEWGARFRLVDELVAPAADPEDFLDVEVEAEWAGFDYFVAPRTVTQFLVPTDAPVAFANAVESGILTVTNLSSGPLGALGLPASGAGGFLDLLAMERGLPREPGESDEALRARIRTLPDMLTPAAILRTMTRLFYALVAEMHPGLEVAELVMWEPWEYGYAPGIGAIGVHPPARSHSFMLIVPSLPWAGNGYAPGAGAIGVHPIGVGDVARDGYYAGLQNQLDRIRAAGIWGQIYVAAEPEPEVETLGFWRLPGTGGLVEPELDGLGEPTAEYEALAETLVMGASLLFWGRVLQADEGGIAVQFWTGADPVDANLVSLIISAGGDWVATLENQNAAMEGISATSSGFPFNQWDFFSIETDTLGDGGATRLYRNAAMICETAGDPPGGGSGGAPCWLRFRSLNLNALDVTNVSPLNRLLTADERTALTAAGPAHDYAEPFDDGDGHVWAGEPTPYFWPQGVLENHGTVGTPTMTLGGDAEQMTEEV